MLQESRCWRTPILASERILCGEEELQEVFFLYALNTLWPTKHEDVRIAGGNLVQIKERRLQGGRKPLRRSGALAKPTLPLLLRLQSLGRFRPKEIEAAYEEGLPAHTARLKDRGAGRGFIHPNNRMVLL